MSIQETKICGVAFSPCTDSSTRRKLAGFTIIEFVIVILIVGVLSAVTMSRLTSSTAFNAAVVRDQIISVSRIALQSAMGKTSVAVTITPNGPGTEVTIAASHSGGSIVSVTAPLEDVTLSGDVNVTDSCGSTPGTFAIANITPMVINYDTLGDLAISGVTGNTAAITSGLRICLNDEALSSLCVSPAGFAYGGDCDI